MTESSDRSENPDPATILAVAEDERHTLLAAAASDHLNREEAELRRYREDIRRIEGVFALRIQAVSRVPEWITVNRQADITQALDLLTGLGPNGSASLIAKARLDRTHGQLWQAWHDARTASPGSAMIYPAWQSATAFLRAARLY